MAEPILTLSTYTFDLSCIRACQQLNFVPPHLNLPTHPYPACHIPLTHNLTIQASLHNWCKRTGHPLPTPTSDSAALHIVRSLKAISSPSPPIPFPPSPFSFDPLREQRILRKLNSNLVFRKRSGLCNLVESPLCSPRVLAAIITLLNFPHATIRQFAARVACSLSRCPENRAHLLRSGIIPALLTLLNREDDQRAYKAAIGAFYYLTADRPYRLMIGAMGVIPPLLDKFCGYFRTHSGWKEVASTLYRLAKHCQENLEVFVENEGVRKLIETVGDEKAPREMRRIALRLVDCLVKMEKGRDMLLDNVGQMQMLLRLVKEGEGVGLASLTVMYRICRGSLKRFRENAKAEKVGAEMVLIDEKDVWGKRGKEMARAMVRVIKEEINEVEQLLDEIEAMDVKEDLEEEEEEKLGFLLKLGWSSK